MVKRFDGSRDGAKLPTKDDDWILRVTDDDLSITHPGTGHGTVLGYDHIHHFVSDPARGPEYGFLMLTVQIHMAGDKIWIEPVRP
jgi:hypothetical protein